VYQLAKPLLFSLDPERAHALSLRLLRQGGSNPLGRWAIRTLFGAPRVAPAEVMGLTFPNRVGLAAGYDKDGLAWRGLAALGFGHVEVGTVTPLPQPGNERPRVFRLAEDTAVINRLGFPSRGADFVAAQLARARGHGALIGANLGKNKATPNAEAARDYVLGVERFAALADYLAVNVSSPNTPGLRELQTRAYLDDLLRDVLRARDAQTEALGRRVPVALKLAPDLDDDALHDALGAAMDAGVDGIIATNTTIRRDGLRSAHASETGGLSGRPLTAQAQAMLTRIARETGGGTPLIAVGGIMDETDARARLDAGAALVQVYTGLVYGGPGLVRRLVRATAG
jgi:dihydroorotate dehydrogenase